MKFLTFLDGFEALIVCGAHILMFVNLKSPEQQIIRGTSINDIEMASCLYRANSQAKIDVSKSEGRVASKT